MRRRQSLSSRGSRVRPGAVWDYLAACKTLANGFGRRFEETYDTIDAIDAPKEEKSQIRSLWRQLVERHLDAPQRVLDDRVRVGRVAPEF